MLPSSSPIAAPRRQRVEARLAATLAAACVGLLPATGFAPEPPEMVVKICSQCHGLDGNSTVPTIPKLAGLQAGYIAKQIEEFRGGNRGHEQMLPVVAKLSTDDIALLAGYFSQQSAAPGKPGEPRLSEIGKLLYKIGNPATGLPSCDGCHAPDAAGGGRFPRLAGQHREYLIKQLNDIREGRRNSSPLMRAVADRLGELEIRALATYLSGL